MTLQFPMRVRCVQNSKPWCADHLRIGKEYTAVTEDSQFYYISGKGGGGFYKSRFKPVVRVKARCVPSLSVAIARTLAAYEAPPKDWAI